MWDDVVELISAKLANAKHYRPKWKTLTKIAGRGASTARARVELQEALEAAGIFPRPVLAHVAPKPDDQIRFSRSPYQPWERSLKIRPEDRLRGIVLSGLRQVPELANITGLTSGRHGLKKGKEFQLPSGRKADFVGQRPARGHRHWVVIEFKLRNDERVIGQLMAYVEELRDEVADPGDVVEAIVISQMFDSQQLRRLQRGLDGVQVRWFTTRFMLEEEKLEA